MPQSKQAAAAEHGGASKLVSAFRSSFFFVVRRPGKAARGGLANGNVSRQTFPKWLIAPFGGLRVAGNGPRRNGSRSLAEDEVKEEGGSQRLARRSLAFPSGRRLLGGWSSRRETEKERPREREREKKEPHRPAEKELLRRG